MNHRFPLFKAASIALSVLLSGNALADREAPDTDCQCRDATGNMRTLGTVTCIDIPGDQYLVRCEMSTNTPYWKKLEGDASCPMA